MRIPFSVWMLSAALLLVMGLSLQSGSIELSWWEIWTGLSEQQSLVVWEIRLPRILMAALVGAGLAVAGVSLQALFRNPLAEPGLIGVSSSAALGAVLVIVLGAALWGEVQSWQMSLSAFAAAAAATLLLYSIATRNGHTDVALMLLAGVALNAIAGALTGLLITVSSDVQLRSVMFWMMGSFSSISWQSVGLMTFVGLIVLVRLMSLSRALNALLLGEQSCLHMGYALQSLKFQIMGLSALLVGVSVSLVGVIGFVGLMVPHMVRLWVGPDHRYLIPLSALGGAVLLVLADWLARLAMQPAELPIGLLMALLGGPFFLMMLLKRRGVRL
ncbi:iron ABC transporter permease [Thiomicrorhabdus sp. ZW0627]|uniref:FecCD family ABC transporter permease n=1 Tax=Thiomicrorhabdus sp. ZW0627 TaxID=3039774 RepID=UPI00243741F3|nr:iron ABC transporter permease [Thiomicrorhabdus sp. ZW0627]MDG6773727.1 iron ABC transporter permease [Thiomicrorhabdus sp. ZW0627]